MGLIRVEMPVLARHEGAWAGSYIYITPAGEVTDRHMSHLKCSFPEEGPHPYYQINTYIWPDGRKEELHFPATYRDRHIWWDNERIYGHAWEIDERSVMLTWTRKDIPDSYLYEMIQISDDNSRRARTWHWFRNDELFQRTIIKEERVA